MKPSVDRSATSRVLADIDEAVRPVERARTAAAVERVLQTVAPGMSGPLGGLDVTFAVCDELDIDWFPGTWCDDACPWCDDADYGVDDLPGFRHEWKNPPTAAERRRYAPWNVSPHLFPAVTP